MDIALSFFKEFINLGASVNGGGDCFGTATQPAVPAIGRRVYSAWTFLSNAVRSATHLSLLMPLMSGKTLRKGRSSGLR